MFDEKPILDQVHELQILVNKLNVLSIPISETLQVAAIVSKLPHSWNDISKKSINNEYDYSSYDLLKHLFIEEESRNRDKRVNHRVGDEEVVVGEGVVVTSSSLEMLTNSCLGGIMWLHISSASGTNFTGSGKLFWQWELYS
nr:copia-like retrotransposon [Tanacetum cinerariifolium]